jgi:DNA-binding NarL/FixJ family response regulator
MRLETQEKTSGILIADDHKVVANLLKAHLEDINLFQTIKTAFSCKEAIESAKENKVDVILLDIILPDGNGIEVAKEIMKFNPSVKIIFLTSLCSKSLIMECFEIGARGFLLKTANFDETIEAIKIVKKGDKYFCRDCLKALVEEDYQNDEYVNYIKHSLDLTDREKEILRLLVEECTVPEIAGKLYLSARTVESHKRNIMTKFGAKTVIGLVKMVLTKNLIEVEER